MQDPRRVADYFGLDRHQADLDFVNVRVAGDVRVFVDPRALRLIPTDWGHWCIHLVQSFFRTVLQMVRINQADRAVQLVSRLREPNETRLGFSRGRPRGRALGPLSAAGVVDALSRSEAVHTGLLEDLEDTILMIEGISSDIVSDIATNLIREPLILYTQAACNTYEIPMMSEVSSGPLWNPDTEKWDSNLVPMPFAEGRPLLLVPKAIVRLNMDYDADEYYRHFLLEYLSEQEANANTELVHLLKDGSSRVFKKELIEKYGEGKGAIVSLTRQHPEVLDWYRESKLQHIQPPMDHDTLAEALGTEGPDWDSLLTNVVQVRPGSAGSNRYLHAIEKLLTTLLYPNLTEPVTESRLHDGRKRIDIRYTNLGVDGFLRWLTTNYEAPYVFVECKNYSGDPGNPELDQLAGRFSPRRGRFGLLVCRSFRNKARFIQRCRDTADDDRGFIVALDDDDIRLLVDAARARDTAAQTEFLMSRFDELVM